MSTSLKVLNRTVAPFFCGVCMAAATMVNEPGAVALMLGFAGLFAFIGLELGSKLLARFSRRPQTA